MSVAGISLTEAEAGLICEALESTYACLPLIWAEVEDAVRERHLDVKWKVDGRALTSKLRALSPGDTAKLMAAIELVWAEKDGGASALRRAGLID
jgi:hypothetical protein